MRAVFWACVGGATVAAALVGVAANAHPSNEQLSTSPLQGHQAPAISGPAVADGASHVGLSQFRHKWVLVNFMASWCTDCREEMGQLKLFYRQHRAAGDATILGVEYDPPDLGHLRSYLAQQGAAWPVVNDPEADVPYGVTAIPLSYLVAPGGTVYESILGKVKASELDSLLRQGARAGLGPA